MRWLPVVWCHTYPALQNALTASSPVTRGTLLGIHRNPFQFRPDGNVVHFRILPGNLLAVSLVRFDHPTHCFLCVFQGFLFGSSRNFQHPGRFNTIAEN